MTAPSTSSLHGARDHARSQAGAARRRSGRSRDVATTSRRRRGADVLWDETIGAGGYAGRRLPRGTVLRIADADGDACVHLVVHNAAPPAERLNVADTVKVQWQAYLGPGAAAAVGHGPGADDDRRRHAAPATTRCAARRPARRRPPALRRRRRSTRPTPDAPASCSSSPRPSTGSTRRDLPTGINLFKRRRRRPTTGRCASTATPRPGVGRRAAGRARRHRAAGQRARTRSTTGRRTRRLDGAAARRGAPSRPADDPLRTSTPERQRAFENTDDLLAGVPR